MLVTVLRLNLRIDIRQIYFRRFSADGLGMLDLVPGDGAIIIAGFNIDFLSVIVSLQMLRVSVVILMWILRRTYPVYIVITLVLIEVV